MSILRDYTQRQYNELETQDYKNGGLTTFRLPEVGLGSRLYLTLKGVLTSVPGAGANTLSELGIRNLISRITVRLNDGTILYEMEGFNSRIPTMLQNGFEPDINNGIITRSYTDVSPFKAPTPGAVLPAGDNDVLFTIEIPFINNDKDMLGLLLLQNGTTQATIEIQWNRTYGASGLNAAVKSTGNATASFVGNISPNLELFTLPNLAPKELQAVLAPHLRFMNVWKSEYEAITSAATIRKKLDRGSIYTKIGHRFLVNGALNSEAVSNFRILMKGNEAPTTMSRNLMLYMQRRNYGFDLPDGFYLHDLDRSYGIEEWGDMRDYIDSRSLTELVSEIQLDSGTVYGADSYLYTITNKLTPTNLS